MVKGLGSKIVPPHAGIGADLRELYKKFKEFDSVRLRDFQTAFQALRMREMWFGRQSAAEVLEYSERLLHMSASYMFSSRTIIEQGANSVIVEHSLLERVFGIYCCFAFYFLQPMDYTARIRVTPTELADLQEFIHETLIPERHLDAVACITKLTDSCAFRVHPFKHAYDPSCHKRYDVPDVEDDIGEVRETPFAELTQLSMDPLLKQLALVHKKYEDVKAHCAPAVRSGKDALDEIQGIITKVKEDAAMQQNSKDARMPEDNDLTEEAQMDAERSLKNRLKDQAYTAGIKHNRNRRYADPNMQEEPVARVPLRGKRKQAREPNELAQEDEDEDCVVLADNVEAVGDHIAKQPPVVPSERVAVEEEKRKKPTPLEVLSDPMARPQPGDKPMPMDSDFEKVLKGFRGSAETRNLESEISQLVGEGVAKKKGRSHR